MSMGIKLEDLMKKQYEKAEMEDEWVKEAVCREGFGGKLKQGPLLGGGQVR